MIPLISRAGVVVPTGGNDRSRLRVKKLGVSRVLGSRAEGGADYYGRQVKNAWTCFQVGASPRLSEIRESRMLRNFKIPILARARRRSRREVSGILQELTISHGLRPKV